MAKRPTKKRHLTHDEHSLWNKITKGVVVRHEKMPNSALDSVLQQNLIVTKSPELINPKPIKKPDQTPLKNLDNSNRYDGYLKKLIARFDDNAKPFQKKTTNQSNRTISENRAYGRYTSRSQFTQSFNQKPQNEPLERNIRQKLQRGKTEIEARLDLHGYNRNNAYPALLSFVKSAWQQGLKTVIVVTGKGDGPVSRQNLHSSDFFQMPEQNSVLKASIANWLNDQELRPYIVGWQPAHPKHGGGGAVYVRIRNKNRRRN